MQDILIQKLHGSIEVGILMPPSQPQTFGVSRIKNNIPEFISSISSHAGAETTITFLGFQKSNAGQYTCVAENQYGKAEQNLLVDVASEFDK